MSERRCYTHQGVHIPGCWGCAIYGHHRCNCPSKGSRDHLDKIEDRLDRLEESLMEMGAKIRPAGTIGRGKPAR